MCSPLVEATDDKNVSSISKNKTKQNKTMIEELETQYKSALQSHNNKFSSLRNASSESAYRDSAKNLKDAYALFAAESKRQGKPLPVWI